MQPNEQNALDRYEELMVDRALLGLSLAEAEELTAIQSAEHPAHDDSLERTAALLHQAMIAGEMHEELPEELGAKLKQTAAFMVPAQENRVAKPGSTISTELRLTLIGTAAAVFFLAFSVVVFWRPSTPSQALPEVAAATFEKSQADIVNASWKTVEPEFAKVEGYVSWSANRQNGFMHLKGLPKNDAKKAQYQLWIVDGKREGAPVDGGVFDVAENGEVVVEIDAKLPVGAAVAFVITKEVPGGVVVSKGPHLVLAAL